MDGDYVKRNEKYLFPNGSSATSEHISPFVMKCGEFNKLHQELVQNTKLLNLKLTIKQQILGLDGIIVVEDAGNELFVNLTKQCMKELQKLILFNKNYHITSLYK